MDDEPVPEPDILGIRVRYTNMVFTPQTSISWGGAGIIDKPFSDFFSGGFSSYRGPDFISSLRIEIPGLRIIPDQVVPEPEEYALALGLFALALFFCTPLSAKEKGE